MAPVLWSGCDDEADTSSCGNSTASSTPQSVVVTWEYRQGSAAWADLSASGLNPGLKISQYRHVKAKSTHFFLWRFCCRTDLDRRPGAIRFAAFSFDSSTTHEFRVTARYETSSLTVTWHGCLAGLQAFFESRYVFKVEKSQHQKSETQATAPEYVFSLTVSPPAPPVVIIVGPSSVSDACGFSTLELKCSKLPMGTGHWNAEIGLQLSAMMFWKIKLSCFLILNTFF